MSSSGSQIILAAGTNNIGKVTTGRTLTSSFVASSAAYTVSGNTGDFGVSVTESIAIDINITSVSGTNPTIQFYLVRKGLNNDYFPIWQSAVLSGANVISTTVGQGSTVQEILGVNVQLQWVITGTTPSFTFDISMQGN